MALGNVKTAVYCTYSYPPAPEKMWSSPLIPRYCKRGSDGRLYILHNQIDSDEHRILYSDDDGSTWDFLTDWFEFEASRYPAHLVFSESTDKLYVCQKYYSDKARVKLKEVDGTTGAFGSEKTVVLTTTTYGDLPYDWIGISANWDCDICPTSGDIVVVYAGTASGDSYIAACQTSWANFGTTPFSVVDTQVYYNGQGFPPLAISNTKIHIAYRLRSDQVRYVNKTLAGAWGTPELIVDITGEIDPVVRSNIIRCNTSDVLHFVWQRDWPVGNEKGYHRWRDPGTGTWSAEHEFSSSVAYGSSSIAVSESGVLWLFFTGGNEAYYRVTAPYTTWSLVSDWCSDGSPSWVNLPRRFAEDSWSPKPAYWMVDPDSSKCADIGVWSEVVPDQSPYLANQDPGSGEINVNPSTNIEFDILDNETGVDESSIVIELNTVDITASCVITEATAGLGFHVFYDSPTEFTLGATITIHVEADDTATPVPNHMDDSYSFTISSSEPPYISNENPAPGATMVALDTNITFRLNDDHDGIDLAARAKTKIWIDFGDGTDVLIWENNAAVPGYSVTETEVIADQKYDYLYNPSSDFEEGKKICITVFAEDVNSNSSTTKWCFITFVDGWIRIIN